MRVGLLGAGWVANDRYLPVLDAHTGVEVSAIYDRNRERAETSAAKYRVPVATGDLDDFFSQELDMVVICTSPWSHCELTLAALEHGCHVMTEKPMAMNSIEAESMASAARNADRSLCVSHNFLFSAAVRRADQTLGQESELRYVMAVQLSSDQRRLPSWHEKLPAGLLFDEIPHLLYVMQHYLGALTLDSVRVNQRTSTGHPATTEILVNGVRGPGQATIVSGAPVSEWHVALVGSDRVIDLDLFRDIVIDIPSDGSHGALDILKTSARAVGGHLWGFAQSGLRLSTRRLYWGHDRLIRDFIDAVEREAHPPVSISDALEIVSLTDEILSALDASADS